MTLAGILVWYKTDVVLLGPGTKKALEAFERTLIMDARQTGGNLCTKYIFG